MAQRRRGEVECSNEGNAWESGVWDRDDDEDRVTTEQAPFLLERGEFISCDGVAIFNGRMRKDEGHERNLRKSGVTNRS